MKTRSAFTTVELLVVIAIITLLSAIAIFAYNGTQRDARDTTRGGIATVISEALEKYYEKNGEYPSEPSMVNDGGVTGQDVGAKLGVSVEDLRMPRMPSGATNPLTSADPPTNDNISYIASSDANNSSCQNDMSGGCDQFTLKYIEESGNTITIQSRHRSRPSSTPTTLDDSVSLTVAVSPPTVVATATTSVACDAQAPTRKFAFSYRTKGGNDSTWSEWSSTASTWSTSNTFTLTGTEGMAYEARAYIRCDNGATAGTSSPPSITRSATYPISAPSAPSNTIADNGDGTATSTASTVTCINGATAQYSSQIRINEAAYTVWTDWSTETIQTLPTLQGYRYVFQWKARCHMNSTDSLDALGAEQTYVRPVDAPSSPTVSVTTPWDGSQITWGWSAVTCPVDTTASYQKQWSREGFTAAWSSPSAATTFSVGTTLQGYQYTTAVQARCGSAYTQSGWSASGSDSDITPIATPGAPTNFSGVLTSDRIAYNWSWTAPACGPGTSRSMAWNAYYDTAWQDGGTFSAFGFYGPGLGQQSPGGTGYPSGYKVAVRSEYKCVNQTSGRESAIGPVGTSETVTLP